MVSWNLHVVVRSGTMWMVELSYTWLSWLAPLCIWHPCCESSLRSRSPLYSTAMSLCKSLILLLIFFVGLCPQDSLMSSCNCIFMSFSCLIEPYVGFLNFECQPYSPILSSHAEPFCISFAAWFPILTGRGLSPECRYPTHVSCIEHRYVPLLGTSLFSHWHSSSPSL